MPLTLYRRGHIWHLRGSIAGRRVRQSTGLSDKCAADIYRARVEAELIERRAYGKAATRTFAEAAISYIEAGGEGRFLTPILSHFGPDKLVTDIDMEDINAAARALYEGAAPATINRQLIGPISAVVRGHFKAIRKAPPIFARRPERNARLRWLTPEEARDLLAACDDRTRPVVGFLLGTGCRTSEAFKLKAPDLHQATGEAFIADPKNGEARMVRLPAKAIALMGPRPEEGAVFRTPKGQAYVTGDRRGGQMQTAFNRARDAAGLGQDVTPHVLRHTWATWYYAQTKDFGGLMDLGGWKSPQMANRYRKIAPADLAARLYAQGWDFGAEPVERPQLRVLTHGVK